MKEMKKKDKTKNTMIIKLYEALFFGIGILLLVYVLLSIWW